MSFQSLTVLWLAIIVASIVIDLLTSNFLFIWFGGGAVVAFLGDRFGLSSEGQVALFIISSIILTAIGYPAAKKFLKNKVPKVLTMEQSYIGREFASKETIKREGRIIIDGIYWGVINSMDKDIEVGELFILTEIKGNKFIIKRK